MTLFSSTTIDFSNLKGRKIQANFDGGEITSDGGSLLLREVDKRLGLLESVNEAISDPRDPRYTTHDQLSLLKQRVYGLALGYEDLNDHSTLRHDPAIQISVEKDAPLGSAPTLCRLEKRANRETCWAIHRVYFDQFINSFSEPPKELILDFDPTDDVVHGKQECRAYNGYYRNYCFLPLYVFCGDKLLVNYLRPSNIDGAKHSWAILSLLVKGIRRIWPDVRIIFRADSGFCRHKMLCWCDRNNVDYVVGLGKNERLKKKIACAIEEAEVRFDENKSPIRFFREFFYGAKTWGCERRVIAKIEHSEKRISSRFVVTNLKEEAQEIYEERYCARGEMENRIKEQQLDMFADRTSNHLWWSNQLRLCLSGLAYCLMEGVRSLALIGTDLAKAQCGTIRLKLLKIGGVILRNTRRIQFFLSSTYPYQLIFTQTVSRLQPG